jgi:hypothetical protein
MGIYLGEWGFHGISWGLGLNVDVMVI